MTRIISTALKIKQAILDIVMPPRCISCGVMVNEHGGICPECWKDTKFIGTHQCKICGLPFEFDMGKDALCKYCTSEKPKFSKVRSVCEYDGVARKIAVKFKFRDHTHLAKPLAKLMINAAPELVVKADIITPVPLHFRRRISRKYNQAGLLALNIAKISGIKYQPLLMQRTRATKRQTSLNRQQRQENVENAFTCSVADLKGKTILLIDDVMTTGSTLNECAKALKAQGAQRVYGLVFARVKPSTA
jgi:ComF family protein